MNVELFHFILLLIVFLCACFSSQKGLSVYFFSFLSLGITLSLIFWFSIKVVKKFFSKSQGQPLHLSVAFFFGGVILYGFTSYLVAIWGD